MNIKTEAERRGRDRALAEVTEGCTASGSPLSPELERGLIARLLGDLIAVEVGRGWSEETATEWVCDDYERGYLDEWEKLTR